jgi:beta-galactosidase
MSITRHPPINPKFPHFIHGGDYSPEQWPADVWDEDMRLMGLAGCNTMTVGIFSWTKLEPAEGRYTFDWLDRIMDKLAAQNRFAILATPSAAQPAWMSRAYPEILRTHIDRRAPLHGFRVNYCLSSPVYRAKCAEMATRLADRYKDHPALLIWHASNEYHGYCYCELCKAAFREWLKKKYTTLDRLNDAWWTAFWSHTYTDWDQIDAPGWWTGERGLGEISIHGLTLDWRRFMTDQTIDFMLNEMRPLRQLTPGVPVTTNMMGTYVDLDCWKMAPHMDLVAWDSYPLFHDRANMLEQAVSTSFQHDLNRSLKGGKPFLLMESTPSVANWWPVGKLKRPGVHRMASLQAVAHGADSVQYFQWRQSRGCGEKFHGSVVEVSGQEKTRAFADVADVGHLLAQLDPVIGTVTPEQVAVIYDWEVRWAIDGNGSPRHQRRDYELTCNQHYQPFWQSGIPVAVVDSTHEFSGFKLVVAPMLYLLRPGVAERLTAFVKAGGTLVVTYWSGISDENDLLLEGGRPGGLRSVLGVWVEATDGLYDDESNSVVPAAGALPGLTGPYKAELFCDMVHAEGAEVVATYGKDFYAGQPVLTVNRFGKGSAWYIGARTEPAFLKDFYAGLISKLGLRRVLDADLPDGVTAQLRTDGTTDFLFLINFTPSEQTVTLHEKGLQDFLTGTPVKSSLQLASHGTAILKRFSC